MITSRRRAQDSSHCGPSISLPSKLALERDKTGTAVNKTHEKVSKSPQVGSKMRLDTGPLGRIWVWNTGGYDGLHLHGAFC